MKTVPGLGSRISIYLLFGYNFWSLSIGTTLENQSTYPPSFITSIITLRLSALPGRVSLGAIGRVIP
jgi:hypothetical protein